MAEAVLEHQRRVLGVPLDGKTPKSACAWGEGVMTAAPVASTAWAQTQARDLAPDFTDVANYLASWFPSEIPPIRFGSPVLRGPGP